MNKYIKVIIVLVLVLLTVGLIYYTYNVNNIPKMAVENLMYYGPEPIVFNLNDGDPQPEQESNVDNNQLESTSAMNEECNENPVTENSPIPNNSYNNGNYEENLYWLSKAIAQELGSNWVPDYYQQCAGSVVLNRVNDNRFPNTIYGVLHQSGQYSGFYAEPTAQNIANAKYLLENGSVLPDNVVFQALFVQGNGIYCSYYDSVLNNTTYFCY